jgi:hypothetical protein
VKIVDNYVKIHTVMLRAVCTVSLPHITRSAGFINYFPELRPLHQRTDIGKYSFVNRTIKLWNNLPAEALVTFPCKPLIFRKRVRKLNISEVKSYFIV